MTKCEGDFHLLSRTNRENVVTYRKKKEEYLYLTFFIQKFKCNEIIQIV